MRDERHVARIEKKGNMKDFDEENLKEICYLEDLGVCGRMILKWICINRMISCKMDLSGSEAIVC